MQGLGQLNVTTFDCVQDNTYLGGLICPGIVSSHSILLAKAAKLPSIVLKVDGEKAQIGKSTETSLSHGFVFGFSAMTRGLIEDLSKQMFEQTKPYVIATGGFAHIIAKHVPLINRIEPNLILLGLILLYKHKQ